jgi:hypothetical protein
MSVIRERKDAQDWSCYVAFHPASCLTIYAPEVGLYLLNVEPTLGTTLRVSSRKERYEYRILQDDDQQRKSGVEGLRVWCKSKRDLVFWAPSCRLTPSYDELSKDHVS